MSFKAINNFVTPNLIILTLLVLSTYPKITEQDTPSPSIIKRIMAIRKTINEVQKFTAFRQMNDIIYT